MSAEVAVRAAMLVALRGDAALMAAVNGVYDGTPVKASAPYVVVGECSGSDWGTKDADGREVRIGLTLIDRGETPAALANMLALADGAVRGMSGAFDGWRLASVGFLRSRVFRVRGAVDPGGGWSAIVDYRVRVLRE